MVSREEKFDCRGAGGVHWARYARFRHPSGCELKRGAAVPQTGRSILHNVSQSAIENRRIGARIPGFSEDSRRSRDLGKGGEEAAPGINAAFGVASPRRCG